MAKQMMDINLETLIDATDDLVITNGDFIIVESTQQHQRQLLLNDKGSFKEDPTICVGIFGYLDDEGLNNISRDTGKEFARDGMKINKIEITNNGLLNIDAYYP
jgi:hypothetical protein